MNIGKNLKNLLKDSACEPEKVMHAIVNNRGYGGFRTMNIINSKTNSLNIVPRKNVKVSEKIGLGFIGKGEFGTAFIGCINSKCKKQVAIKMQTKKKLLKHEYEILKMTYDITPHVTIPYLYKDCGKHSILYTEYANGGDFENIFKNYQNILKPIHIQTLIFQVIFTIYAIQEQYPTFRHFDLHPGNIFLDTNFPKVGGTKYITGRDVSHNFRVPNIGIRSLIGDFGLANIKGEESNNVKTLQYINNYGVGPNTHKLYDLHFLLGTLYEITETANLPSTKRFRMFVEEIFPKTAYLNELSSVTTKGRLMHGITHKLPTPAKLLENTYFRPFRMFAKNLRGHSLTDVYPKKHNPNTFKKFETSVNVFANFQSKLKPLKLGQRSPISPVAYKNKLKLAEVVKKAAKRVAPRTLLTNIPAVATLNMQRILNALKARVASPVKMPVKRKKKSPAAAASKNALKALFSNKQLKALGKMAPKKVKANTQFNVNNSPPEEEYRKTQFPVTRPNVMKSPKKVMVRKPKARKSGEFEIASTNPVFAPKMVVKQEYVGPTQNVVKAKVAELKAFIQDADVQVIKSPTVQTRKPPPASGISTLKLWQMYKKKLTENYYDKMSKNSNMSYQNKMNEAGTHAGKIVRNKQKAGEEPPQYVSK